MISSGRLTVNEKRFKFHSYRTNKLKPSMSLASKAKTVSPVNAGLTSNLTIAPSLL